MSLADVQQLVDSLVRDASGTLTPEDRDRAIEVARLRYSADAPRQLSEDVAWPEAGCFGPLPASWVPGAWLQEAECPPGAVPPAPIELAVSVEPEGARLVALYALDAGSTVRVRYGAPHLLQGGDTPADTIVPAHREAVASYAAHLLCKQLATHYSGEREASIGADGSHTDSRARNYAARARDYRATYYAGIGKPDPIGPTGNAAGSGAQPAAASVGAWPGRGRAFGPGSML